MLFPDQGIRREVSGWAAELRGAYDEEAEAGLEQLLDKLLEIMDDETADPDAGDDPEPFANDDETYEDRLLAAAEGWAAVASHAVASVYAPNSPFPRGLAGFSQGTLKRLRRISQRLQGPLAAAQSATGATSFSISVSFPWGISVSLNW